MPFFVTPTPPPIVRRESYEVSNLGQETLHRFEIGNHETIQRKIQTLTLGETVYPVRKPFTGTFIPTRGHQDGELYVSGFPMMVGKGKNYHEAEWDWRQQFHIEFQTLVVKRPFEMSNEELLRWRKITDHVDVLAYESNRPVKVRKFGKVVDARPRNHRIQWESGDYQAVDLAQMPAEFAAYVVGQPFDAIAVYDSVSMKFLKVDHITRRKPPRRWSEEEREEFWKKTRSSNDLPDFEFTSSDFTSSDSTSSEEDEQ